MMTDDKSKKNCFGYGIKGSLSCSYHGLISGNINDTEIQEYAEKHRIEGCPLALTWKTRTDYGYRG